MAARKHTAAPGARASAGRKLAAEIGSLLARSRRQVFQRARRRMEALGESIFVWRLLAYLHDEGPAIQAELADAIQEMLADNQREKIATRARAYQNLAQCADISWIGDQCDRRGAVRLRLGGGALEDVSVRRAGDHRRRRL